MKTIRQPLWFSAGEPANLASCQSTTKAAQNSSDVAMQDLTPNSPPCPTTHGKNRVAVLRKIASQQPDLGLLAMAGQLSHERIGEGPEWVPNVRASAWEACIKPAYRSRFT